MSARVTSLAIEVLRQGTPKARVTSVAVDVLRPDEPAEAFEVTGLSVQVAHDQVGDIDLIGTQLGAEVLAGGASGTDVTALGAEVLSGGDATTDVTALGVEVLYRNRAFLGCVDRPVAFRLRVRTAADDGDAVVFTSLADEQLDGADGWPLIADEPEIDAATVDPLTGKTDLGACTITLIDAALDAEGALAADFTGPSRVVTALLADGSGRSQLIGRRVFVEASDDNGATWGAYWSGYLTDLSFPDAITAAVQMTHTGRDDESRMVFSTLASYPFATTGNLAGGPVRVNVPVANAAWRVQYDESPWTIECTSVSGDLAVFTITNRFLPWDVARDRGNKKRPMVFLNEQAQRWFTEGGPTPALTAAWRAQTRFGWFPRVQADLVSKNGAPYDARFAPVAINFLDAFGGGTPDSFIVRRANIVEDKTGDGFTLYWPASTGTQPAPGDDFTMYLRPVDISGANPGWIRETHPVDVLTTLWTAAGYAYDSGSATDTKAALGDYRVSLRITADQSLAEASAMLCGAFGFGWRMDPTGVRVLFPTRAYPAPTTTITADDLASDEGVVWQTSERSKVGRVAYTFRQFYTWPAAQDGDETTKPSRALDGVTAIEMKPIIAEAPTAQDYGVRTQAYDVPGFVYDATGRPLDAFAFVDAQAVPLLAAYQDGAITTEIAVLPTVDAFEGTVVTLDLPHRPGFDTGATPVAQRGTPEVAMVIRRQPTTWGATLTLLRVGEAGPALDDDGADDPGTVTLDESTSAAATTGQTATSVTVTLDDPTDYATIGATVRVAYAVQATEPEDNGLLWPTELDPAVGTLALGPFPPASTVWVRTQVVQGGVPLSGYSAWQSVTLDALTGTDTSGGVATPSVLLSVDGSFNVSALVEAPANAVQVYCLGSTTGYPDVATLLGSTPDASAPFTFATVVATLAAGTTAYVAAIAEDAQGNRSLRGVALYTRPDGTGGGGGGSVTPIYTAYDPLCPPASPSTLDDEFDVDGSGVPTGWTGTGTAPAAITVAKSRLLVRSQALTGFNTHLLLRDLPAGPFTVATRMQITGLYRFCAGGLVLRRESTERAVEFGLYMNTGGDGTIAASDYRLARTKWSALNTRDSIDQIPIDCDGGAFVVLTYDGTTVSYLVSTDGITFRTFFSESMTVHFTGGNLPDKVGFYSLTENASQQGERAFDFFRYFPTAFADIGRDIGVGIP